MSRTTLQSFLATNRFRVRDILPRSLGISRGDVEIIRAFAPMRVADWSFSDKKALEFRYSLVLAEYMADCSTEGIDDFRRLISCVGEDAWVYALKFCPYHKISVAIDSLLLVQTSIFNAYVGMNASAAGMGASMSLAEGRDTIYVREQHQLISNLLNFVSLYNLYVDICRRVKIYAKIEKDSEPYRRAIWSIMKERKGVHEFVRELRNYMLHFNLERPGIVTKIHPVRVSSVVLHADKIFASGFSWGAAARRFLSENERLDILSIAKDVVRDIDRLVKFHVRICENRLPEERRAYATYIFERERFHHLQRALVDHSMIFSRKSTTHVSRLVDPDILGFLVNSAIPNDVVKNIIISIANRYSNLPSDMVRSISQEVDVIISKREFREEASPYFEGRPLK